MLPLRSSVSTLLAPELQDMVNIVRKDLSETQAPLDASVLNGSEKIVEGRIAQPRQHRAWKKQVATIKRHYSPPLDVRVKGLDLFGIDLIFQPVRWWVRLLREHDAIALHTVSNYCP